MLCTVFVEMGFVENYFVEMNTTGVHLICPS